MKTAEKNQAKKFDSEYYSRQRMLLGKCHKKILKKTVLIVGAGGTGSHVSELLCRAGVNLIIADPDKIEASNLNRQVLYTIKDIGKNKALTLKNKLKKINDIKIVAHNIKLNKKNYKKIKNIEKIDLIIDCTDNLKSKLFLNWLSFKINKPLIYSSATNYRAEFYFITGKNRACLNCFLEGKRNSNSKAIINTTPSIIATLIVNEAIKFLCNKNYEKNYYIFNLEDLSFRKFNVKINPYCEYHK